MGYYAEEKEKRGGGHFGEQNLAKLQRANSRGPEAALEGGVRGRFLEEEPKLGHFYF